MASSAAAPLTAVVTVGAGTFQNGPQQIERVGFIVDRQHLNAVEPRHVFERRRAPVGHAAAPARLGSARRRVNDHQRQTSR